MESENSGTNAVDINDIDAQRKEEIMEISRKWKVITVGAALTGVGLTGVALADTSTPVSEGGKVRRSASTPTRTPLRSRPTRRIRARTTLHHPRRHPHPHRSRAMVAVVGATIPPAPAARLAQPARTSPQTRESHSPSSGLLGSAGSGWPDNPEVVCPAAIEAGN